MRGVIMSVISLIVTDEEIKQKPRDIGIMLRKLFLPFGGAGRSGGDVQRRKDPSHKGF